MCLKVRDNKIEIGRMKAVFGLLALFSLLAVEVVVAQSVPGSPDTVTVGSSGRHVESAGGVPIGAEAGNVTALVISETRVTQFWQGYYGNVSGSIVLDDAANNTLFAWELASPAGEIFAVNTSDAVQWNNVTCVNFTAPTNSSGVDSPHKVNLSTLATQFNMNTSALSSGFNLTKDAINNTFNTTYELQFQVANTVIGDDAKSTENCMQLYTFVNEAYQVSDYAEVLLFDNRSALIFAAFLENNLNGFQSGGGDLSDFQMMVAERGTPGAEAASTYYFYVELE